MNIDLPHTTDDKIYVIYDGECLICSHFAQTLKIRKIVGELKLINARTKHPLVQEAVKKGYDLNEGMVVKFQDKFYYGADAVHVLALFCSRVDWLINSMFFYLSTNFYLSCFIRSLDP
jgi:predicted DCC family thiol-disulfide oxidoreductase YuxK